jgi:signal transduction histidine kinase
MKALEYAIKKSDVLLKNKDYKGYCQNSLQKSKIYGKLNDVNKSIDVLFNALKIAEKHHLQYEKVLLFNAIGRNFKSSLNLPKSLEYYRKGEKIAARLHNDTLRAFVQQNIFKIFIENQEKDSARQYAAQIMRVLKKSNNFDQVYRAYSNFSVYHFMLKEYELGKKYLDTASFYAEKNKKLSYLKTCYMNLGYYYLTAKHDYKNGEKQYLKILSLNKNDTTSAEVTDVYLNLSYVYEKCGDFKKANKYLNKYVDNTEVLFQNKINTQLKDAETKYEIDKVESEYKQRQTELLQNQSKNQKIFIVIIALLIVMAILFYFFNQNNRLKEKNKLKDIESKIQQNIINATLDGQEIERKKIAGVLHDSISAQLSSAGLHLSAFSATTNTNSEEIVKTRAILKEAHDKVRDLSHELLPTLLAKFGLLYALQDLCEKNSNSLIEFEYESNISNKERFNEEYEMKVYFIIAELLNNVLKHSDAGQAKLTINENNAHLEITIEDNGKGFDTGKSANSEGFGLTQIRARITNMKGKFIIDSTRGKAEQGKAKPGSGTTIRIRIPAEA